MSTNFIDPAMERRPFTGFDRERETYRRLKPALMASDPGREEGHARL